MAQTLHCPACGAGVADDAPDGSCPVCALRDALSLGAAESLENPESQETCSQPTSSTSEMKIRQFGDYEILEEIARGGMGVVYRAQQLSLNRTVALKMILTGNRATEAEVKRFRAEAGAIARLHHPNIVAIHEVGFHEGQHYFSMDFVTGKDLGALVREHPLPAAEAARYIETIAIAIHYAHQQGVLHRDLKPSNVLLDENREPRVTDFGLAKRIGSESDLTLSGQVLGSPNFMPPEQAAGKKGDVRPYSDVYSLGAILYYLLTGRPPFLAESLQTTLAQVMQSEPISLRTLNSRVPADLETICLKCLEKAPARRYQTAKDLADELGRFQRGESILARPVSKFERGWRWCHRNPALAASLSAAVLLLVTVAVGSGVAVLRIAQARKADREHLMRLKVAAGWQMVEQGEWFDALAPFAEALELDKGDARREEAHKTRIAMLLQTGPRLRRVWFPGGPLTHIELSRDGLRVLTATSSWQGQTNQAAAQIWDLRTGESVTPPMLHAARINFATFNADGTLVITASEDKTAQVWDATTGAHIGPPLRHADGVTHAAFSPDGKWVATCTSSWPSDTNGYVCVWNPLNGSLQYGQTNSGMDSHLVLFTPDSRQLLIGSSSYICSLIDFNNKQTVGFVPDCWRTFAAEYSPDGHKILVAGAFGHNYQPGARFFDTRTWQALTPLLPHSGGPALAVALSPDCRILATGGADQKVRLWDANTGEPTLPPLKHAGPVSSIEFSPDGRMLLTASRDGTARVWDTDSGFPTQPSLSHGGPVCRALFASNGQEVITGCDDGAVRVWALVPASSAQRVLLIDGQVRCARFSPDGRWIATGDSGGILRLWDASTLEPVLTPMAHSSGITSVKFSTNGDRVMVCCQDETICVWDVGGNQAQRLGTSKAMNADFAPDGNRVVNSCNDCLAQIWDAGTGAAVGPTFRSLVPEGPTELTFGIRFSPDGHWIGLPHESGTIEIWDALTIKRFSVESAHRARVINMWFNSDSSRFVTVSADNTARIWDRQTGIPLSPPLQHSAPVTIAGFSPNGQLVVTASDDATVRLWTSPEGKPIGQPMIHHEAINDACFSADGQMVATASSDGTARVWDTETGEPLSPSLVHAGKVWTVAFSPDGGWLLTASDDQSVRLWRLPKEYRAPADLQPEVRVLASFSIGHTDELSLGQAWSNIASAHAYTPQEEIRPDGVPVDSSSRELPALLSSLESVEQNRDFVKAARLLDRISELTQENWLLRCRRADAKAHLADHLGAIEDYTRALRVEPNAAICWLGRYLARSAQGDTNALSDFREALQRVRGFRVRGIPTAQVDPADPSLPEQWETVVRDCSAGLRKAPAAVYLLCARGVAESGQLRWAMASRDFEQAARLEPTCEETWLALALTYRNLAVRNDTFWPKVLEASEHALNRKPSDPLAQSLKAEAIRNRKTE